jgi:hypothetical protein
MAIVYNTNIVRPGIAFHADFANPKGISGTTLTDLSNNLSVSLTNPGANTVNITNGYAEFLPADLTSTATFYTISNSSYFNNIKSEITLETALYVYSTLGSTDTINIIRGVSPRVTETGSPLGFSLAADRITYEVNTNLGWTTGQAIGAAGVGHNKWVYITQVTSVIDNSFKTYVNGALVATLSLAGGIPTNGNGILIGRGFYAGIKNYHGRVGFVRVYSTALSATQVAQNFNAQRGRFGL